MKKTIMTTCLLSVCLGSSPQAPDVAAAVSASTTVELAVSAFTTVELPKTRIPSQDPDIAAAVSASTTVELPKTRISYYHNVGNAKELYEAGKQDAIKMLVNQIEKFRDKREPLTKGSFWNLLRILGIHRYEIAQRCNSEERGDFGVLRLLKTIKTELTTYDIMSRFVTEKAGDALKAKKMSIVLPKKERTSLMTLARIKAKDLISRENITALTWRVEYWGSKLSYNKTPEEAYDMEHMLTMDTEWKRGRKVSIWKGSFYEDSTVSRIFYGDYVADTNGSHAKTAKEDFHVNLITFSSADENSPAINDLFTLFQKLVSESDILVLFQFFHKFAVIMPYMRGSCAANEWILEAGCRIIGVPVPQQLLYAEFDQMAQISNREEFVAFMMARFERSNA